MNRTEMIYRIIKRKENNLCSLKQILEEELPDFNPYKIDEERMSACLKKYNSIPYNSTITKQAIQEYNSTLPPALVPLPKEMPDEFHKARAKYNSDMLWHWVVKHYGTPEPKPSLPSVEELEDELWKVCSKNHAPSDLIYMKIAQHLHDKYSLKPREWWQDLKEGDKFVWKGQVKTFRNYEIEHKLYIDPFHSMVYCPASECTPYTITADEIIAKYNLSEEEVRVIREGKCT